MNKTKNPYPPKIIDDSSDEVVSCHDHEIWRQGYTACDRDYHSLLVKMVTIYDDLKSLRKSTRVHLELEGKKVK